MFSREQIAHFGAQARTLDYDRFLACYFAPKQQRTALHVLICFYHEIARIPVIASEPIIGMMRLTWWREALEDLSHDRPFPPHDLLKAVADIYAGCPEMLPLLLHMIEARMEELDEHALRDEAAWLQHTDATAGAILAAACLLLGISTAECANEITAVARMQACVGFARAIPTMAQEGSMRLPERYLQEAGLAYDVQGLSKPSIALQRSVSILCHDAHAFCPIRPRVEFLQGVYLVAKSRIKQLQKASYNTYDVALNNPPIGLLIRILMNSTIG